MLKRRTFLVLGSVAVGALRLGLPIPPARAQSPQAAGLFVQQTGGALAAVVNGPGSEAERKARLAAIVARDVDIDGIARFCLGRFWRTATPGQQAEYLSLFRSVLQTSITSHLGEYRGVSFAMGGATPGEGGISVATVISRPNAATADVNWIVTPVGGHWKIIDVVAEGTSLRVTQRADYLSYLARNENNLQALIDALRRQVGQSG